MADWRGYFYVEDLGMAPEQRQVLIDALKAWGVRNLSVYPNERNHWAIRPDQLAVIFEAVFDDTKLTAAWFESKLAELYNVSVDVITYNTISTVYGPAVTYKYLDVNKLRMGIFGGLTATWNESHEAVLLFLADNQDTWGVVEI